MRLNLKATAAAAAVLWGGCYLFVALLNWWFPPYGEAWLQLARSIYPGYRATAGFAGVIVVTLYALLDGAVAGLVIGWTYNAVAAGKGQRPQS